MRAKVKPRNVMFCFHHKFDTGTWTIATAFASLIIFSLLFVLFLSYSVPTCFCATAYQHLSILPTLYQIIYAGILLFIALLNVASLLVIYGTFKVQEGKLLPYILLMFVVEIGVIVASVYAFIFIYNIEGYLVLDHETYDNMAKLVLKKDVQENLNRIMTSMSEILKYILKINPEEVLNLDNLMKAVLKEEVIDILGGMKQMMKVSVVIILVGINSLFIFSIMVVCSHYHKLRIRFLRSYSGVPEMVIHRPIRSDSTKRPPSDSLSDASGLQMHKIRPPLALPHHQSSKELDEPVKENFYGRTRDSTRGSRRTRVTANGTNNNKPKSGGSLV